MSELQQFCASCGGAISYTAEQAGTSIFCMHCGQKIQLLSGEAGAKPQEEKGDSDIIHVTRKGEPIGPYSREEAKEYFIAGTLLPTDWGWHDGMDDWKPLNEVLGMAAPTAIAPECPNGHGETREWEGQWRCWECGWTDNSDLKKKPKKKKKKPNKAPNWLAALGWLLVSLVCFGFVAYLLYDLFLADGILEKKEMSDLKQRVEAILQAEEAFFAVIDSEPKNQPDNDYGWILEPSSVGRIVAAQATLEDKYDGLRNKLGNVHPDDDNYISLAPYESQKVHKLAKKYESKVGGHLIDWRVWYDMHGVRNPLVRKIDIKVLGQFNAYKRERKVVLDELDREFQSYGLGSLKR